MKDDERESKEDCLADYIVQTKGYHCEWALQCLGAQFIYLVNVVGQIFFTDCFLGWEFSKYGVSAASFTELDVSSYKHLLIFYLHINYIIMFSTVKGIYNLHQN